MKAAPSVRVRRIQLALRRHHFDLGRSGVDGRFGPRTRAAVRRFQTQPRAQGRRHRRPPDPSRAAARDGLVDHRTGTGQRQHGTRRSRRRRRDARRRRRRPPPRPPATTSARPAAPAPATAPVTRRAAHGTGWAVPLAIGLLAAVLVALSAPMLWDPVPRPHRRADRAGRGLDHAQRAPNRRPRARRRPQPREDRTDGDAPSHPDRPRPGGGHREGTESARRRHRPGGGVSAPARPRSPEGGAVG